MPAGDEGTKMLRPNEAAARLGVSREVVYRLLQSGELPAYRIRGQWRVSHEKLLEYLETCRNV